MAAMEVDGPAAAAPADLRALAIQLHAACEALQDALSAVEECAAPAVRPDVTTEAVLECARRLRQARRPAPPPPLLASLTPFARAQTAAAPPGWPNNVPLDEGRRHCAALYDSVQPPVPTELQLQASLLHRQPPLPSEAAAAAAAAERAEAAARAEETASLALDLPSLSPEALEALLAAMPPRPAGWKPGDALPPLPVVPKVREDLRYVPRVEQLGSLNPDLEGLEFDVGVEEEESSDEEED